MIIGIYVVIKFLMLLVLFITELTIKIGSKVFKGLGNSFFFVHIVLEWQDLLTCHAHQKLEGFHWAFNLLPSPVLSSHYFLTHYMGFNWLYEFWNYMSFNCCWEIIWEPGSNTLGKKIGKQEKNIETKKQVEDI